MADKQTITTVVAMLCEAFGVKPTKATYMAYGETLSDVPDDVLRRAAGSALRHNTPWMPKPGELLDLCLRVQSRHLRAAVYAWQQHIYHDRRDPLAHSILAQLAIEQHSPDFYISGRKRFVETYAESMRQANGSLPDAVRVVAKLPAPPEGANL